MRLYRVAILTDGASSDELTSGQVWADDVKIGDYVTVEHDEDTSFEGKVVDIVAVEHDYED